MCSYMLDKADAWDRPRQTGTPAQLPVASDINQSIGVLSGRGYTPDKPTGNLIPGPPTPEQTDTPAHTTSSTRSPPATMTGTSTSIEHRTSLKPAAAGHARRV